MKKLRIIWQLLTRRHYLVVTADKHRWRNIDYDMDPDQITRSISRIEVQLQAEQHVACVKEMLHG